MPIIDHLNNKKQKKLKRKQGTCIYDKLLSLMSIHKERKSIIDDTVQMDLFICLMCMRDSSTDAVNENETEKQNTKKIVHYTSLSLSLYVYVCIDMFFCPFPIDA